VSRLLVALVLVCACAADDPPGEVLEHRFTTRPVRLMASEELPGECIDALTNAVLWFRQFGATLSLEVVDSLSRVLNGVVVGGEAGIVPGELGDNVRGSTRIALTPGGDIYGAEVTLSECDPLSVAHECGHVLGLVHADKGNLMYLAIDGADWVLDQQQQTWIPDDPFSTSTSFASTGEMTWDSAPNVVVIDCY
jgi:hypothetical protein